MGRRLDLFQLARHDSKYEIDHYGEALNEMVKEGKFDYIGYSEVGAETVRRAHKVRSLFINPVLPDPIYARVYLYAN